MAQLNITLILEELTEAVMNSDMNADDEIIRCHCL